jgi:uncharacterized membrane protein YozB (DUF420 family)
LIPRGLQVALIIAGLAAIVAFVPHGGSTAGFIARIISIAMTVLFALFAIRLYQTFQDEIHGLGDRHRLFLYGAIGLFVLAMAWRNELFDTAAGSMLWIAMIAGVLGGLYASFLRWRAFRV